MTEVDAEDAFKERLVASIQLWNASLNLTPDHFDTRYLFIDNNIDYTPGKCFIFYCLHISILKLFKREMISELEHGLKANPGEAPFKVTFASNKMA